MNRLLIVPQKTSSTPEGAVYTSPKATDPIYDLVEISCVFTWDKKRAEELKNQWKRHAKELRIGGPAYDDPGGDFSPGMYVKEGITITSRGCPFNCSWCYVPKREGKIRELSTIHLGNIVQDNNLLSCNTKHVRRVFDMLRRTQKGIRFVGGLDARLLKDWHVEELRSMSINELWLAYDSPDRWKSTQKAIQKLLKEGFRPRKIRTYVMIGFNGESLLEAEERLRQVYREGSWPFAQVYDLILQTEQKDVLKEWKRLARTWQRPPAFKAVMRDEEGIVEADF